ncbi:LysE family translocator [Lapillicoccus jejuensis]|uniref:Threonine/homoserine/homoserine lactone efflux protein n=1 Tax=Lapillicoccus jejuensis TaxID=402171 RepID=A0A542DZE8_9MICO|nr:LysE family translocator [Lapillicoccus jejuensis]TQJ08468.1 threonine/homoserine/homoserine lactone efflux protein [Lapillicoccus jejuensis]
MPSSSQWVAFLVASALFIQVPGPSLLFTIGRALTVGRRDALLSVVGNGVGVTAQAAAVGVGLGAVAAQSVAVYSAIKLVGAVYVVWLGVQAIRHRADARLALAGALTARPGSSRRSLRTGLVVGLTNPKTMVFFAAFLPQFVNPASGHSGVWIVVLGAVFGAMAICSDSLWALGASRARDWFARRPQRLDRLGLAGGVMMIGLGTTLAVSERA